MTYSQAQIGAAKIRDAQAALMRTVLCLIDPGAERRINAVHGRATLLCALPWDRPICTESLTIGCGEE